MPTGALPDGRSFQTIAQFKALLAGDRESSSAASTEKLLIYALGRGLERYDRPAVTAITKKLLRRSTGFQPSFSESSIAFRSR